jgi:hypothetical protein
LKINFQNFKTNGTKSIKNYGEIWLTKLEITQKLHILSKRMFPIQLKWKNKKHQTMMKKEMRTNKLKKPSDNIIDID